MKNIFWTGYSSSDRHHTINRLKEIVSKHGDIVDFRLFSDVSMVITIEIQERKVDDLYEELRDFVLLDEFEALNSSLTKERVIYLNLTFTRGTGDLRVAVPAVPG